MRPPAETVGFFDSSQGYYQPTTLQVDAGATASSISVFGVHASVTIQSGGVASNVAIDGATELVSSGGIASATALASGGNQLVFGAADGGVVNLGSSVIEAGGSASGMIVNINGSVTVDGQASNLVSRHRGCDGLA